MKVLATHLVWNHNFTETYGIQPPDVELNWRSAVEIRSQSTNNLGIRHQRLLVHYVVQSRSPNNLGIRHQRCSDTGEMTVMIRANNDHKSGQQERSRDTSVRELFFFLQLRSRRFLVSYTQISETRSLRLHLNWTLAHSLGIFGVLYPDFNDRDFQLYTAQISETGTLAHICLRLKFLVSYTQISTITTSNYTLAKSQRLVHSCSHSSSLEIFGVLYPDFNARDFKSYTILISPRILWGF